MEDEGSDLEEDRRESMEEVAALAYRYDGLIEAIGDWIVFFFFFYLFGVIKV